MPVAAHQNEEISIGWGECGRALLDPGLDRRAFERVVHAAYYPSEDHRGSGRSAGQLWRFIRAMTPGSLVLIPHHEFLNVVRVTGEVTFHAETEHWAYRRAATWLSRPSSVFRRDAGPRLQSRARTPMTCVDATDLLAEIRGLVPGARAARS